MKRKYLVCLFFLITSFQDPSLEEWVQEKEDAPSKELTLNLKNPTYKDGILTTTEGGVIQNDEVYIQAEKIQYIKGRKEHAIHAEKNILLQYKGHAYTGEKLCYNFSTKTGLIYCGKTFISPFYIGGDEIFIQNEGTYDVKNAFITTCENQDSIWNIHAQKLQVTDRELFYAQGVRFRYFNIPFWLPSFHLNLKKFFQPMSRYKVTWDKGAGPKVSLRYQLYSWNDFALYARGEWRLKRGLGGALETEYCPEHKRSYLITKSYLATDVLPTDPVNKRRYRLQGEGKTVSPSQKSKMKLSWDKYSDVLMPGDFKSEDFELNTAKENEFYFHHKEKMMLASLKVRPRVNSFQSIKQQLPTGYATMKSYQIPSTGIICDAWAKTSYLKLTYSDDLAVNLPDFNAGRLEGQFDLYRPFHMSDYATITPKVGGLGIFYSNNPQDRSILFSLLKYGIKMQGSLYRKFQNYKHVIQPYVEYKGYSQPSTSIDRHFIFSIQDGYNKINQLTMGIHNLFLLCNKNRIPFSIDLYAHAFLANHTFAPSIPRIYLDAEWSLPTFMLKLWGAYNNQHNQIDFSNFRALWTINENAAFTFEFRYRSIYHYRKADPENFILDVTRDEDEILLSPLSDRRVTILAHMFLRLSPFWSMHFRSHHGFLRKDEPSYNELRLDLFKLLTCNWRMHVTYQHTQRDDRVSVGFDLLKN